MNKEIKSFDGIQFPLLCSSRPSDKKDSADLWILNSCTVKNPAEDHLKNEIAEAKKRSVPVVVSGCVPQGAPQSPFLKGLSIIGVQQIDRVVEVVEETMNGT
jgi:threonylcarbamoyladenosine tRNA methylthiotransferase CDKAL1